MPLRRLRRRNRRAASCASTVPRFRDAPGREETEKVRRCCAPSGSLARHGALSSTGLRALEDEFEMIKSLAWRLTLPIIFVGFLMMLIGLAAGIYVYKEHRERYEFVADQIAGENVLRDLVLAV